MQAKTTEKRLEEAIILLDAVLECFEYGSPRSELQEIVTFLDEEDHQKMQGGPK